MTPKRNIWLEQPPYYISAYEIAVKHGFVGTEEEWLESLHASVVIDPLPTEDSDNVPRSGGLYDLLPKVLGGDGSLVPALLLTQEEYDELKDEGEIDEHTLYLVYEAGEVET